MLASAITDKDLKIHVHHVGGIGDCGPTEAIRMLGNDVEWTVYDADESALSKMKEFKNENIVLVNKCIGANNSKVNFHITRGQSASSLLKGSPEAKDYTLITGPDKAQIWGIHTQITKSIPMELSSIDSLLMEKQISPVDFLSIDAQGAELDIINGASRLLTNNIMGVLCEVEFSEIYENQPLFCDIEGRLRKDNFRFCQIYNSQYWNTYPFPEGLMGEGFNIVGEALFLKNPDKMIDYGNISRIPTDALIKFTAQCLKLAAVAVVFDQLDFGLKIIKALQNHKLISLDSLAEKCNVRYIKLLRDLVKAAEAIEKSKTPLEYQSSCSIDYKPYSKNKLSVLYYKLRRLFRITVPPLLTYYVKKFTSSAFKERSVIIKIYRKYGLNALIEYQSRRLWWK
ncbi:MAG: FkbM family methyltransferase [Candidatus Omnitrophota bacterium]|jgi:FkbM family methyltransferase